MPGQRVVKMQKPKVFVKVWNRNAAISLGARFIEQCRFQPRGPAVAASTLVRSMIRCVHRKGGNTDVAGHPVISRRTR